RAQRMGGLPANHAVACEDQREGRRLDQAGRGLERAMVRRWPPGPLGRKRRAVGRLLRHVLGNLDVAGPGLLRLGQLEGLAYDLGNYRAHLDPRVPLRQRTQVLDDVDVLMRLLVYPAAAGL